jgi:hypothetical protein
VLSDWPNSQLGRPLSALSTSPLEGQGDGIDEFSLRLDIKNVAGWLDKQISNMIAANVVTLRGPLSATLAAQPPAVGSLPAFELDLAGTRIAIHVRDPLVSTAGVPTGASCSWPAALRTCG